LLGLRELKRILPESLTILGISNISYGLPIPVREILNGVFLQEALDAGLDAAIMDTGTRAKTGKAGEDADATRWARDLVYNRQADGDSDPLTALLERFKMCESPVAKTHSVPVTVADRLQRKILDGDRGQVTVLVDAALVNHEAQEVVNAILLPAMQSVSRLFEAGKMPLPFVLQAAEVMRVAMEHLEPLLRQNSSTSRSTLVLATVAGDVHDIGKNLVDILLRNNGFDVINLGVRVPVEDMIRACEEHHANALGMSGLLVQSALTMRDNLDVLRQRGMHLPVMVGGAALSERFCREELAPRYDGRVIYGADAFEALRAMQRISAGEVPGPEHISPTLSAQATHPNVPKITKVSLPPTFQPPFLGTRVVNLPVGTVFEALDTEALFLRRWQYRRGTLSDADWKAQIDCEARPALAEWQSVVLAEGLIEARAIQAFLPCIPDKEGLVVMDESGIQKARFAVPTDVPGTFAAFVVTIGNRIVERIADLFAQGRYRDYLHLHGLAVECAEAAAETIQQSCITQAGGFPLRRMSFGYPGCPGLDAQKELLNLLGGHRIGLDLTQSFQMVPEYSVSAFLVAR